MLPTKLYYLSDCKLFSQERGKKLQSPWCAGIKEKNPNECEADNRKVQSVIAGL